MKTKLFLLLLLFTISAAQSQSVISLDQGLSSYNDQVLSIESVFTRTFTARNTGFSDFTGQIKFRDSFNPALTVLRISASTTISGTAIWNGQADLNPLMTINSGTDYIVNVSGMKPNELITFTETVKVTGCLDGGAGSSAIEIFQCDASGNNCNRIKGSTLDPNDVNSPTKLDPNVTRPDPATFVITDIGTAPSSACTFNGSGTSGVRHRIFRIGKSNTANLKEIQILLGSTATQTTTISNASIRFSMKSNATGQSRPLPIKSTIYTDFASNRCVADAIDGKMVNVDDILGDSAVILEYDEYNCCPAAGSFGKQEEREWLHQFYAIADCGQNIYTNISSDWYNVSSFNHSAYYLQRPTHLAGPRPGQLPDIGNCLLKNTMVPENDLAFFGFGGVAGFDFSMTDGEFHVTLTYDKGLRYTGYNNALANIAGSQYPYLTNPNHVSAYPNMLFRLGNDHTKVWQPVDPAGTLNTSPGNGFKESRTFVFRFSDVPDLAVPYATAKMNLHKFVNSAELVYSLESVCEGNPPTSRYKLAFSLVADPTCPNECEIGLDTLDKDCAVMCPGCLFPGGAGDFCRWERTNFGLEDLNNNSVADNATTRANPAINNTDLNPDNDIRTDMGIIGDTVRVTAQYYLTAGGQACVSNDNSHSSAGPDDQFFGNLRYSYMNISVPYGQYFNLLSGQDLTGHISAGGLQYNFTIPYAQIGNVMTIFPNGAKDANYYFDLSLDNLQPYLAAAGLSGGKIPGDRYRSSDRIFVDFQLLITRNEEYGDHFQEIVAEAFPYFSATPDLVGAPPSPALPQLQCDGQTGNFSNWPENPTFNSVFNHDTKFLCEGFFGGFNLVGVYRMFREYTLQDDEFRYNENSDGCQKFLEFVASIDLGKDASNLFANEVRLTPPISSFEFPVPAGYTALEAQVNSTTFRPVIGGVGTLEQTSEKYFSTAQLPAPVSSTNNYTLTNIPLTYQVITEANAWTSANKTDLFLGDEHTSYVFLYRDIAHCSAIASQPQPIYLFAGESDPDDNKIKIRFNNFPGTTGASSMVYQESNPMRSTTPSPQLELRNPGGTGFTVNVHDKTFQQGFVLKNLPDPIYAAAMYPFVTIRMQTAGEFSNLRLLDNNGNPLAETSSGSGIFKLNVNAKRTNGVDLDRLLAQEEDTIRIHGQLNCQNSKPNYTLILGYGWDCNGYPATTNNICSYKEQNITVVPYTSGWVKTTTVDNAHCDTLKFKQIATSTGGAIYKLVYNVDLAPGLSMDYSTLSLKYGTTVLPSSVYTISPAAGAPNPNSIYTITINDAALVPPFEAALFGEANTNQLELNFNALVSTVCNAYSNSNGSIIKLNGESFCGKPMIPLADTLHPVNLPCRPFIITVGGGTFICATGGCTDLTASIDCVLPPVSYAWVVKGTSTVLSTSALLHVCPAATTTYIVTVTNGAGQAIAKETTVTVGYKYEIGNVSKVCGDPDRKFCVPLNAVTPVENGVIGMDYCLRYDKNLMVLSTNKADHTLGSVVTHGNPAIADFFLYNDAAAGQVHVSIFYKPGVPTNTYFTGTGNVICLGFTMNAGISPNTVAVFDTCELQEDYTLYEKGACYKQGLFQVIPDTLMRGKLIYRDNVNKPLGYLPSNPAAHLITKIYGTDASCNNQSTAFNNPVDVLGNFSHRNSLGSSMKIIRDIAPTTTTMYKYINGLDCSYAGLISTLNGTTAALPTAATEREFAFRLVAGDVNMNGHVKANDITLIQQRIVKLI
ncbi:MAG: hypothetical protein ACJ75J_06225, partial [Cytophagaceae bacterium]